jgi:hypothetical protein
MSYRKGAVRERQVQDQLERNGWVVTRCAGSKGHGAYDLHCSKAGYPTRLVQVKATAAGPFSGFPPASGGSCLRLRRLPVRGRAVLVSRRPEGLPGGCPARTAGPKIRSPILNFILSPCTCGGFSFVQGRRSLDYRVCGMFPTRQVR